MLQILPGLLHSNFYLPVSFHFIFQDPLQSKRGVATTVNLIFICDLTKHNTLQLHCQITNNKNVSRRQVDSLTHVIKRKISDAIVEDPTMQIGTTFHAHSDKNAILLL